MARMIQSLVVSILLLGVGSAVAGEVTSNMCGTCGTGFAGEQSCCGALPVCASCCCCPPRVETRADFLWIGRRHTAPQPLIVADVGGALFNVLDAEHLDFEVAGGLRTDLLIRDVLGQNLEFSYLGVINQRARRAVAIDPTIPNLNSVNWLFFGTIGGTTNGYNAEYQSDLHSAEGNLVLGECWGIQPLVGVRWLQLDEELELFETVTPTNGVLAQTGNQLLGAQAGADVRLWEHAGWFEIDARLKAGVYQNRTRIYADTHSAAGPTGVLQRDFNATSLAGDIQLTAVWHVTPAASLRAGYTGLWLSDLALAADQSDNLDLNTGQGDVERTHVALHGGHLGFEYRW